MSYGIWRTRGNGWSSIEIDSPWNEWQPWDSKALQGRNRLEKEVRKHNEWRSCSDAKYINLPYDANGSFLRFRLGQFGRGRSIVEYAFDGGEHVTLIAYDNEAALRSALNKQDRNIEDQTAVLEQSNRNQEG